MTTRRSTGKLQMSRALWYAKAGTVELRPEQIAKPNPDEAQVRALYSGISRGTERLIFSGQVGASEYERMRAPLQAGHFPFPVKYGYCAVGTVEIGPSELRGKTVFCLHPHQEVFNAPVSMLVPVPDGVPAKRATLTANAETALNALWDAGAGPGDRIAIVGAGIVGLMVTAIAARLPGAEVTVVDVDASRRAIVEALGARFEVAPTAPSPLVGEGRGGGESRSSELSTGATQSASGIPPHPSPPPQGGRGLTVQDADIVVHTSVTQAGLNTAISLAGLEGTIVELSWYGDKPVTIDLGGPFHSKRLKILSSQVGQVSPAHRPRWSYRRRMETALRLLAEIAALDALVAEEIAFADAPKVFPALFAAGASGLAPVVRY